MSVVIVSDLHAHPHPRFASVTPEGVNSRFAHLLNVLDSVEHVIADTRPSTLMLLGDLTHRRTFVSFAIYTPLVRWIARMPRDYGVQVVAVVGNHDWETRGAHSLGPLAELPGVTVVDSPQRIALAPGGPNAYVVPYLPDNEVAAAFQAPVRDAQLAFAHYALDGKVLGTEYEYALPSPLRFEHVERFDRTFFGHVHAPSIEHAGKVVYVGAPLHFDFGDAGNRFCWYIRADDVDPTGWHVEPRVLCGPRFVTARYPKVPSPPAVGGYLRVLNAPPSEVAGIESAAADLGWLGCKAVPEDTPAELTVSIARGFLVDEALIRSFVAERYGDLDDVARERIVAAGLRYLAQAHAVSRS